MSDAEVERQVGDLTIRIDRTLCVGFGDCVEAAAEAFVLDDEGVVIFVEPEKVDREKLLEACDTCPVDALTVWDSARNQLVPR
ncbi:MAG TPA: ferredoxin [Gemmatimonadales bacterium]